MRDPSLFLTTRACASTVALCAPALLRATWRPLERDECDRRLSAWAAGAAQVARIESFVEGLEHVRSDEVYVVMSNHQSNFDVVVLLDAFPGTLRMIAKKELRSVPFLGSAMELAEFVFVDRGDQKAALASLRDAASRLASGVSVWIAPEGTRSVTGELLPFKSGGFLLARKAGCRILPATVIGTREILPPGSLRVAPGRRAGVVFHPPVDPAEFGRDFRGREALMETVREAIARPLRSAAPS